MPLSGPLYRWLLGYLRAFDTLEQAETAIAPYAQGGHEHSANADNHLELSRAARPSDYAALFHLQRLLPRIRRVFDLGGNVGNLFYCYGHYLSLPEDVSWQVHDLPDNMARGRQLALQRGAHQLSFTDDWSDASGADLLLISGALHYMRQSPAEMISALDRPPEHILINRTPLTEARPFATIQDGGAFRVACMVNNRDAMLGALDRIGYRLEDSWQAAELSLAVPADPAHTVPCYSGLLLRRAR